MRGLSFVIAGASSRAARIIGHLSPYRPEYIIDGNPSKCGDIIGEYRVFLPCYFQDFPTDAVVITTLNYFSISEELRVYSREIVYVLPPVELIYGYS